MSFSSVFNETISSKNFVPDIDCTNADSFDTATSISIYFPSKNKPRTINRPSDWLKSSKPFSIGLETPLERHLANINMKTCPKLAFIWYYNGDVMSGTNAKNDVLTFVVSSRQFNQHIKRISNTKRDDIVKIIPFRLFSTYWNADFDFRFFDRKYRNYGYHLV